jgi:hypothetical protein
VQVPETCTRLCGTPAARWRPVRLAPIALVLAATTTLAAAETQLSPPGSVAPLPAPFPGGAYPPVNHAGTWDDSEPPGYTGEILAADVLSFGLIALGARSEGPNGEDTDATGAYYLTGILGAWSIAPIIHAAHHQGRRAAVSLVLRQGLAWGGMIAKMTANQGCTDGWFCELDGIGQWFVGGLVVASVIDLTVLTHGKTLARRRIPPHTYIPTFAPVVGGGMQAGLVGTW